MVKDASQRDLNQAAVSQLNNFLDTNTRVAFLRNHVTSRRTILLFIDASTGVEEITSVWDINNAEQLKFWVKNNAVQFLEMLISLRKQRDEAIGLVMDLSKELNEDKYKAALEDNSCFVNEITHARNDANQVKELFKRKREREMQLQKELNVLKAFNEKVDQIDQLTRAAIEKSRSFVLFSISRSKNTSINNTNLFIIHVINFIIVSDFISSDKKFNKLFSSNKFIDKKDESFKFLN